MAAGDLTILYATSTALTWTPASLANSSYDGSASVTNTTNKYIDVLVGGKITTGTTPTVDTLIQIFAYGSWDGGTTFTAGISGSDGGTPGTGEENLLKLVDVIKVDATSDHTYEWGPVSLAQVFGGLLPEDWGLVVYNGTGVAFNSTAGNFETKYTGVKYNSEQA